MRRGNDCFLGKSNFTSSSCLLRFLFVCKQNSLRDKIVVHVDSCTSSSAALDSYKLDRDRVIVVPVKAVLMSNPIFVIDSPGCSSSKIRYLGSLPTMLALPAVLRPT